MFDYWGLEEAIPSIISFYKRLEEGSVIINTILKSVARFPALQNNIYFENFINQNIQFSSDLIFLDNTYWDKFRPGINFTVKNHFNWNFTESLISHHLNTYPVWFDLYPCNLETEKAIINMDSIFIKTHFYKLSNNIYDLNSLNQNYIKHHDYHNNIRLCSSLFWQQYPLNQVNIKGFNFFWYEPFGAVEIGVKALFTYSYELMYPFLEDYLCLYKSSQLQNFEEIYSDTMFNFQVYKITLDHNISKWKI